MPRTSDFTVECRVPHSTACGPVVPGPWTGLRYFLSAFVEKDRQPLVPSALQLALGMKPRPWPSSVAGAAGGLPAFLGTQSYCGEQLGLVLFLYSYQLTKLSQSPHDSISQCHAQGPCT